MNYNDLSEFDLNGDNDGVTISKFKRSIKKPCFKEHLDNLMSDTQHVKESSCWLKKGEVFEMPSGYIPGGFLYVGDHMIGYNRQGIDSALINPNLTTKFADPYYKDSTMKYWPKYSKISASCRGAYLFWLASGREDPGVDIGYVFLYLYGLERRMLIDRKNGLVDDDELIELYNEVKRLHSIYGSNKSFRNYSEGLMNYSLLTNPNVIPFQTELRDSADFEFKFYLARMSMAGKGMPAVVAMQWATILHNSSSRSTLLRCREEAFTMFRYYYNKEFGDGIILSPSEEKLTLKYTPSSQCLSSFKPEESKVFDPSFSPENKKLIEILERIEKELVPYSRFMNKFENTRDLNAKNSLSALVLLPKSYHKITNNKFIADFKEWLDSSIKEKGGNLSLSNVWLKLDMLITHKVTKKELNLLINLFEKTGYGFSPDHRYNPEKLAFNGNIYAFKTEQEGKFEASNEFYKLQALIKIGASLFAKNDKSNFINILLDIISGSQISRIESMHLYSYLKWILGSDLEIKGFKPFIKELDENEKRELSLELAKLYTSLGKICNDAMKNIEKVYTVLGVDKALLITDLHNSSSSSFRLNKNQKDGFSIDKDHLNKINYETEAVQNILSEIFDDEDDVSENEVSNEESELESNKISENETDFNGLEGGNFELFNILKTKDEWENDEVEAICKDLGLMQDGAIEEINDWSFDLVDAPLIEVDDIIYVDFEILEEIENI